MRKPLRIYESLALKDGNSEMAISTFLEGSHGHSAEFIIGDKRCSLAENQVADLVATLIQPTRQKRTYRADRLLWQYTIATVVLTLLVVFLAYIGAVAYYRIWFNPLTP